MTDETPAPTKRSRKKAAPPAAADLVGVMADAPSVAATEVAEAEVTERSPVAVPGNGPESAPAAATHGGTTLRLERGGIGEASADKVEVKVGGIGTLVAKDVFVEWGGVGAVRTERLGVEFGSVGAALAGEARITQGYAGAMVARDATIEQGLVRTLIAQNVTVNRPSGALVMIAQRVSGDVRVLIDWRGALAIGLVFGVVSALVRALGRRA